MNADNFIIKENITNYNKIIHSQTKTAGEGVIKMETYPETYQQVNRLLQKQLELLAEKSKSCSALELCEISKVMVHVKEHTRFK